MISVETLLPYVKQGLRATTTAFDDYELTMLIRAAQQDLGVAGVIVPDEYDDLVAQAIVTYCKAEFGLPEDADRLKRAYDEKKSQLVTCTGYTDWGEA